MNDGVLDIEQKPKGDKENNIWKILYFILSSLIIVKLIADTILTSINLETSPLIPIYAKQFIAGDLLYSRLVLLSSIAIGQILMIAEWVKIATIVLILAFIFTWIFGAQLTVYLLN